MFDFDRFEGGSQKRFDERLENNVPPHKRIKHLGWWLVHNCVAHPLIGVLPIRATFDFHDWTSKKLNEAPARLHS